MEKNFEFQKSVRDFSLPVFYDNVDDYYQMIYWMSTRITEPPATRDLIDYEISLRIQEKQAFSCEHFPCQTQTVERTVKLVTERSSHACSQFAGEGILKRFYSY